MKGPETVRFTVWFPVTLAEAVAVTVIGVDAVASDPAFEDTDKLTVLDEAGKYCEVLHAPNVFVPLPNIQLETPALCIELPTGLEELSEVISMESWPAAGPFVATNVPS